MQGHRARAPGAAGGNTGGLEAATRCIVLPVMRIGFTGERHDGCVYAVRRQHSVGVDANRPAPALGWRAGPMVDIA
jgi:hypothetical protein